MSYLQGGDGLRGPRGLPFLQRAIYVVSEPVFDEEDVADGKQNTIVLPLDDDLERSNDSDH